MGKPINSRNFGEDDGKIAVLFYDGTGSTYGYILRQVGANRYIVTNDTVTKTCRLAHTTNLAQNLTAGYCTIQIETLTGTKYVKRLSTCQALTTDGSVYSWPRDVIDTGLGAILRVGQVYNPVVLIDFKNGVYKVNGSSVAVTSLLESNVNFGDFDPAGITAGVGLSGADQTPAFKGAALSTIVNGGIAVFEVQVTGAEAALSIEVTQEARDERAFAQWSNYEGSVMSWMTSAGGVVDESLLPDMVLGRNKIALQYGYFLAPPVFYGAVNGADRLLVDAPKSIAFDIAGFWARGDVSITKITLYDGIADNGAFLKIASSI